MTTLKDRYNLPTPIRLPRAVQITAPCRGRDLVDWFDEIIPSAYGAVVYDEWTRYAERHAIEVLGVNDGMGFFSPRLGKNQRLACLVAGFEALGYRRCE